MGGGGYTDINSDRPACGKPLHGEDSLGRCFSFSSRHFLTLKMRSHIQSTTGLTTLWHKYSSQYSRAHFLLPCLLFHFSSSSVYWFPFPPPTFLCIFPVFIHFTWRTSRAWELGPVRVQNMGHVPLLFQVPAAGTGDDRHSWNILQVDFCGSYTRVGTQEAYVHTD